MVYQVMTTYGGDIVNPYTGISVRHFIDVQIDAIFMKRKILNISVILCANHLIRINFLQEENQNNIKQNL